MIFFNNCLLIFLSTISTYIWGLFGSPKVEVGSQADALTKSIGYDVFED